MITSEEKDVTAQIDLWIAEDGKLPLEQIKTMSIQHKMGYINMRDMVVWTEFKLKLRKRGYII